MPPVCSPGAPSTGRAGDAEQQVRTGFASAPGVGVGLDGTWGLTCPRRPPRPFAGAAPSPSSVSLSGVEARSWSPVSEARGRREQPGECWIRSVKSSDICSSPCPAQEPSMAPIIPLTYSHTRCWRGLPRAGARPSQTHSLPLQDEESRVPQHAARGWCQGYWGPGEGRQGHLVKDGMGAMLTGKGREGTGWRWEPGVVGGNGPQDRVDGWALLGGQ